MEKCSFILEVFLYLLFYFFILGKIYQEANYTDLDLPIYWTVFEPVSIYFLSGCSSPKDFPRKKQLCTGT